MKLRQTPSKRDANGTKNHEHLAEIMSIYLESWDVKSGGEREFIEKYMEEVREKVLAGAVRLPLPNLLGYLQVLEHAYEGKSIEHLRKFGNVDYSVLWIKDPRFVFHKMKADKTTNKEARERKISGVKYLNDYVDGNTYSNA